MKRLLVLFLFSSLSAYAEFTLNNNVSAGFDHDLVNVFITSNSTCTNAQVTKEELILMVDEAVSQYWNRVPTSRLFLRSAGLYQTTNNDYLTGELCDPDLSSCGANTIPKATDIIIACNDDTVRNFPPEGANPSSKIALALPNHISGGRIIGSVIVINDTLDTPFKDLSYASKVAVLAHEIGHAFGLGHSDQASSLMFYRVQSIRHSLGPDDFRGITYLYPKKVDGCGLLSTEDAGGAGQFNFLLTFLLGLLLAFLAYAGKKLVFKD